MRYKRIDVATLAVFLLVLLVSATSCNTTRHLKEGQHLLRSNSITLKSDKGIARRGELKDNLAGLIAQKPNNYWLGIFPVKLSLYNSRYDKYQKDSNNFQLKSKTVEAPVIYDSSLIRKSVINMKGYLFHEGYFYSEIKDTTIFKKKKAFVTYKVVTGQNYLVNEVELDIDDKNIGDLIKNADKETYLQKNLEFGYTLLEQERVRLTNLLRNNGFYYMSNDNINFELDTLNKQYLEDIENPFENALNFITLQKDKKKPTLNVKIIVRRNNEPKSYIQYGIGRVRVFPDYEGVADLRDSSLLQKKVNDAVFRYHKYYVHENVLYKHILLKSKKYYRQEYYDQSISRLNELGIFQSVRIFVREDTTSKEPLLNTTILLAPTKRFDFSPSIEVSTGSIYVAGTGVALSLRNRNVGKGANLLTLSTNAGIEYTNDTARGFSLLTRRLGANISIDFPKFLIPGGNRISAHYSNAPRTILGLGVSMLDRVTYFTLINTSANFTYRWKETETKSWEVSPAFANLIRLPEGSITPAFRELLQASEFLQNAYRETFIEGENITFTFTNREKRIGRNYSYLRLGFEEAGGIVRGLESLFPSLGSKYDQYIKFDIDAQQFFRRMHSTTAFRFYSGVGVPYGRSTTLPYIKQYFAGGPYSIRGWRLRTLGPGGSPVNDGSFVDRTGDIKLELNSEYRFDITKIFAGAAQINGAVFADAGNIWLAKPSSEYPDGTLSLNDLPRHIALSSGAGIRIDIASLIVLRFDLAVKMKDPSIKAKGGWVTGEKGWPFSADFLNPNIAIGYPF